jgi:serine/threonine protein phosphatase PrpC
VFQQTIPTNSGENLGLYLVCDGLGGLQAGEVASQLAVETVTSELKGVLLMLEAVSNREHTQPSTRMLRNSIKTAITRANTKIRDYAQNHQKVAALGTTITLALVYGTWAQIANVGDSRAYLWRSGQLTQLTEDHSLAAKLVKWGEIDEADLVNHPRRNVLYRTLGMYESAGLEMDMFEQELQPDDKLLLCSDGLWQAFPDTVELEGWLAPQQPASELCHQLVTEANWRGGVDNISVVIVSLKEAAN